MNTSLVPSNIGKDLLFRVLYGASFKTLMDEYNISFVELNKIVRLELVRRELNE